MKFLTSHQFCRIRGQKADDLVAKTMCNACKPMHHWKANLVSFLLMFWIRGNSLQKYAFVLHM